jgi:hypothetical protein
MEWYSILIYRHLIKIIALVKAHSSVPGEKIRSGHQSAFHLIPLLNEKLALVFMSSE